MAKVEFFPYNANVLLIDENNEEHLFESVSECVNYCNEHGIDAEV